MQYMACQLYDVTEKTEVSRHFNTNKKLSYPSEVPSSQRNKSCKSCTQPSESTKLFLMCMKMFWKYIILQTRTYGTWMKPGSRASRTRWKYVPLRERLALSYMVNITIIVLVKNSGSTQCTNCKNWTDFKYTDESA